MIESAVEVKYSQVFNKQLKRAPLKIKEAFLKRREIFIQNPTNSQLNNHKLTGEYAGYRSINITGDWRAIFSQTSEKSIRVITFHTLGTHSQLYK